ncbi:MAG TPA: hypothetical protein VK898_00570 [Chloroflexota bacterium]|jgi:hypothetical protein|nr:hypothetical protein [Chloroflexota bacterium]
MSVPSPTGHDLFALLWATLADIMGTAATAMLLRRAARRAAADVPELEQLVISREGLEYGYAVPATWRQGQEGRSRAALRALVHELGPLLVDLTGPIVVGRLQELEPLLDAGVVSIEEVAAWLKAQPQNPYSA